MSNVQEMHFAKVRVVADYATTGFELVHLLHEFDGSNYRTILLCLQDICEDSFFHLQVAVTCT